MPPFDPDSPYPLSAAPSPGAPVLKIVGGRLTANGKPVTLRGANVSGFNFATIQGWAGNNPWGGSTGTPTPDWDKFTGKWAMNLARICVNQASWLGYECTDFDGRKRDPDPAGVYRQTLRKAIDELGRRGAAVIIDLHWSAPYHITPLQQNIFMDQDSKLFWREIAREYRHCPHVMFELFNEPVGEYRTPKGKQPSEVMRNGGTLTGYCNFKPGVWWVEEPFECAGFQQVTDIIRKEGATNIVIVGCKYWCKDTRDWLEYKVDDPLGQLAAAWHAYPAYTSVWGTPQRATVDHDEVMWEASGRIIEAGYPLFITEFGDQNSPGTRGSPFMDRLLAWVDRTGAHTAAFTWDNWTDANFVLLKRHEQPAKNAQYDPTDGYGEVYFAWLNRKR